MKKLLLSLAAVAFAASLNAASYEVFNIENPGEWTATDTGYTQTMNVNGKSFTITSSKDASTNALKAPNDNKYSWRVYKGSSFTISSADIDMKQVVITFDTYTESDGRGYVSVLELSAGWAGVLNENIYTLASEGLKSMKATASAMQVRIKSIVVSDEAGNVEPPVTPELPEGTIYENDFGTSVADWTKVNDETLSDAKGWTCDTSYKYIKCSSYWSNEVHKADCLIYREFDCSDYKNVAMSVDQAFGYDFPTAQVEWYTAVVREAGTDSWFPLVFTNFPPKKDGKNFTDFATNTFDLSEYDESKVEIGFRYLNDGTVDGTWELKNFKLTGEKNTAVSAVISDAGVASYYTLQGVRVANPEKGIYIVVNGGKASKVIF